MKRLRISLFRSTLSFLILLMVLIPQEVWAQAAPAPNIRNSPKPWMGMILMIILGMVVLVISLFPSKRSHQD